MIASSERKPVPEQQCCAEHPARQARGTCERCGRFTCQECVEAGGGERCVSCVRYLLAAVPSGSGLARWTAWLLYAQCVVGGLLVLMVVLVQSGQSDPVHEVLVGLVALVEIAIFIATAVVFLCWLHRSVRQVQAFAVDVGASPGLAVGYWFIPVLNLFRPYQIMGRLAVGAGAAFPAGVLGGWWAAWVLYNLFSRAEARVEEPALVFTVISAVLGLVAALLCVAVVKEIERGLGASRASLGVEGARPY